MQKIIDGVKKFQNEVYPQHKERFEELADMQEPKVLFITCSDSRIDPNLITQTLPGELFVCRNAGNIVPTHFNEDGGMTASIEYAVSVLQVTDVVICGHSNCGAMKAAMNPESVNALPHVKTWIEHSRAAKEAVEHKRECLEAHHLPEVIKQNVILQMNHLSSHPAVYKKLQNNDIALHGWVYDIESGKVESYDPLQDQFIEL